MELTFTTLQPLAHYDPSKSKADADDTAPPVAGPSSASAATSAFKRELEDRTFDVDDEEFELEAAFERGEDDTDDDHDEDGNLSAGETSPGHKPKHELGDPPQQGSTSERSSSSSFTADSQDLYGDVFPEEVADAMIRELKEIGKFRFPCIGEHPILATIILAKTIRLPFHRHVPLHPKICCQRGCASSQDASRIRRHACTCSQYTKQGSPDLTANCPAASKCC